MIFEVLDHFPGATKRTRPAESLFAIRFERNLLFLGHVSVEKYQQQQQQQQQQQ